MAYAELIPPVPTLVAEKQKTKQPPEVAGAAQVATAGEIFDALANFPSDFLPNGRAKTLPTKRRGFE